MTLELEDRLRERLSPSHADGLSCSRQLYAFAAGELSPAEAESFQRHLRECPACRLDLASFGRNPSPAAPTASARRPWYWRGLALATAATAATALAVILWQGPRPDADHGAEGPLSNLHAKGAPQLQIAIRRGNLGLTASPGQAFADGDTLGFFYSSSQPVWPVILHANQQGDVTRVYPKAEPELLPPAQAAALPAGALIEPASGCEWLVAFFSPETLRPSYDDLVEVTRKAVAAATSACGLEPMSPGRTTQVWPLLRSPLR